MSATHKRGTRKTNKTGRSQAERYMTFGYDIVQSAAWRRLGGPALKCLIELRSRYNGRNNGLLSLGLTEAAREQGMSKSTAHAALKELEAKGFLRMTRLGQWYGRKATEWRLTFLPMNGELATNDWKHWRPKRQTPGASRRKTGTRYPPRTVDAANGSASVPHQ